MRNLLLAAIVCCITPQLVAQQFSKPVVVNPQQTAARQQAPQLAFAPDGTMYCGWIDYTKNAGGDIVVTSSTDGGATFREPVGVRTGGRINSDFQRTLLLAADRPDRLHVVWMESRIDKQPDIYYSRSTDGGITFSEPVSVSGDEHKWAQDFPSLAVDGSGGVYICFLDSREQQQGQSAYVQLYLTVSSDGGETFTDPVRTTYYTDGIGGTCECCATDIAVTSEGHLYLAYRSNINNRRDVHVIRSLDGGISFETPILAASEPWFIESCPVTGPAIDLDADENLHITWRDSRPSAAGKNYIYYTMLPFGGQICLLDRQISGTVNRSDYPDITAFSGGGLLCIFEDGRNDAGDIFFAYSTDGGASFSTANPLEGGSPGKQLFAVCATDPVTGHRFALWQDNAADNSRIMMSVDSSRLTGTVSVSPPKQTAGEFNLQCYPNPAQRNSHLIISSSAGSSPHRVSFYDINGKLIKTADFRDDRATLSLTGVAPGIYFIEASARGETTRSKVIVQP